MKQSGIICLLLLFLVTPAAIAQTTEMTGYGRRQTFAAFFDYSNDSSHIFMGKARNRKFADLGFQYEYRLKISPRFIWKYTAEFRPAIAESDPTASETIVKIAPPPVITVIFPPAATLLRCTPGLQTFSITAPITGVILAEDTTNTTCGRRWTYAMGLSPLGTRINLRPRSRWQPTASVLAGLLLSAKKIPIETAGSFNFTFQFGAGLEYFRTRSQSIRLEYQLQHFSNGNTASANPGVDNGLFKLTYTFGK
jgi:opacity protein-like surface antigen